MSHDKEGNRCLDVARSRFTFTLNMKDGQWQGGTTWRFSNPSMRQVDNKYQSALIMLRSFHIGITHLGAVNNAYWAPPAPVVHVELQGLSMPNNAQSRAKEAGATSFDGIIGQSSIIGAAEMKPLFTKYLNNLNGLAYPIGYGSRNHGSVAECGRLVAGDVVNGDIVVTLASPIVNFAANAFYQAGHDPHSNFQDTIINHNFVIELEVQLLLNYNKPDSAY